MDKNIFINFTRHEITREQIEIINEFRCTGGIHIIEDLFDDERVLDLLFQSPSDIDVMIGLADMVARKISDLLDQYEKVYVLLPIGSPLQQSLILMKLLELDNNRLVILYAHSKRNEDKSFKFEKFIVVNNKILRRQVYEKNFSN